MTDLVAMAKELRARANSIPQKNEADFRREILVCRDEDSAAIEHTEPTPAMRAGFRAIVDHDRNVLGLGEDHIEALKAEIAELVRSDFAAARAYCEQHGVACRKRLDEFETWRTRLFAGINEEIIIDNERRAAEARQRRAA